ncbi:TIGR02391 family protein [Jiangella asiatica]|uniref:Conserved hypothetical protein CHP02391 domain-containing protein n=1 Tax=Jiangella asiatica TaxID=2530372 RepID=A0A4R5D9C9_9ACTN|nr:TIGR02391 family protein [Jiangella asiatica]TDE10179.1 hypothetical protein E1269_12775 [Jiangella asiatica]
MRPRHGRCGFAQLAARGVHQAVHDKVREWLRTDYYDAVFESVKALGPRLRSMKSLDLGGWRLVDEALLGKLPLLLAEAAEQLAAIGS